MPDYQANEPNPYATHDVSLEIFLPFSMVCFSLTWLPTSCITLYLVSFLGPSWIYLDHAPHAPHQGILIIYIRSV